MVYSLFILLWPGGGGGGGGGGDIDWCIRHPQEAVALEATRQQMVLGGIIEERESYFQFRRDYASDWDSVVERMAAMEADCPQLIDAAELPDWQTAWMYWLQARQFMRWMEDVYPYAHPVLQYTLVDFINAQEYRIAVWDLISDINNPNIFRPEGRRLMLQRLRTLVGRDNYEHQRWPSHVPKAAFDIPWRHDK